LITTYALKPRFQTLIRPFVGWFGVRGITPNQVTIAAMLGSVAVGLCIASNPQQRTIYLLLPFWLFIRMVLNALDGMLARSFDQRSRLGAFLNEIGDIVSDAALYAPLALLPPFGPASVTVMIAMSVLSEFAGILGPALGASRRYDGPMGKSDRAVVFGALGLWVGAGLPLPEWLGWAMSLLSVLLVLTAANRVRAGLAESREGGARQARSGSTDDTNIFASSPEISARPVMEKSFRTHDGVDLFYRVWPATSKPPRGAIVMFHRGHEHSGRMAHLADEFGLAEFTVFAWDARGHGRSPGERGFSPSLGTSVRDVQTFIDHIVEVYGFEVEDIAVVAQSVGAVLVATWAHDYAPKVRCLVLAAPAFKVKLYIPFARVGLKLIRGLRGGFFVKSYVKAKVLTHDSARVASYQSDPLITRAISVDILLALYGTAERVIADARAITIPTQLLISGADWVVHHGPQHRFFERLGAPIKERHIFAGFYHDTLGERDRKIAVDKVRGFVLARFAEPLNPTSLLDADRMSYTRDEADVLASPLPPCSPGGLYWGATRMGLRIGGFLSEGIKLGRHTGFDSGSTLDYIYRNRPQGHGALGRLIDRSYLNSIGWRGIRQRKVHVEELLRRAMDRLRSKGAAIRVVDVAAGHGRYVLEALEGGAVKPDSVLLQDFSDRNVAAGTKLIHEKGLAAIVGFRRGDAFDHEEIATIEPRPTLGVVSGLYELFSDNQIVGRSLGALAAAIPPGGYLVYTGQPWHPQLELIARALTSHREGRPWVMRRRTQAELDQLVAAAGFRKVDQRIDEWGMFTVALAERCLS
jgi:alpha-beta hydrolase superfamily lysophospholipase/phosphatidylglycerophosphate synthase